MADHDGAAGEALEGVLERAQRVHVEVVRGLVEQQQVRARAQQLGQVQAVALAAREVAHLLLLVAAAEVEAGDVRARRDLARADAHAVDAAGDLLPDRLLAVQRGARLVDVGELDRLAEPQRCRCRAAPGRRSCGRASSCPRRSARRRRRCRRAAARSRDPRSAGGRRSPCSARRPRPPRRPGGCPPGCGSRGGRSGRWPRRPAATRSAAGVPCPWPGGPSATCRPTPSRARARDGAPTRPSPRARGAPASAPASRSSCPGTGCPCRGRARGSSRPRCRGSSGHA